MYPTKQPTSYFLSCGREREGERIRTKIIRNTCNVRRSGETARSNRENVFGFSNKLSQINKLLSRISIKSRESLINNRHFILS